MKVGDVCLVRLPNNQIENHIKFETGCMVLVIQGENAGRIGRIEEIKNGMFSLPKRTVVNFDDRSVELPIDIVMPIGIDSPLLEVFNQ
jgi:small subunit ribosomal protein S4e